MDEKKYVLIEWQDGWREVMPVEGDAVGLRKYFVVERIEYYGRLVVDRPDGEMPGLVVTDRKPLEVQRVVLIGDGSRDLKESSTYEEGGKVEYNYELVPSADDPLTRVKGEFVEAFEREGLTLRDVRETSLAERRSIIGRVAAGLRLVGSSRQDDLIDFVEQLVLKD